MAEGILRHLYGDRFDAYSAGTEPSAVNPAAIDVMSEIGIDISQSRSKSVSEFLGKEIDYVVTLCSDARKKCPFFPGAKDYIHRGFDDPAGVTGSVDRLASFRRVRDELRDWIARTFGDQKSDGVHDRISFELQSEEVER